jgi:hypothetical protein
MMTALNTSNQIGLASMRVDHVMLSVPNVFRPAQRS